MRLQNVNVYVWTGPQSDLTNSLGYIIFLNLLYILIKMVFVGKHICDFNCTYDYFYIYAFNCYCFRMIRNAIPEKFGYMFRVDGDCNLHEIAKLC